MTINRHGQNSEIELPKFEKQEIKSFAKAWFKLFGWWFVFCGIASLAFTGGLIYVAWHFISKYW